MILEDWRDAPPEGLAPLYEAERARWLRILRWDTSASWREVEQARSTWGLPGLVARDPRGPLRGFAFYLLEGDRLDLGGLCSDDPAAIALLLDGVLTAVERSSVRTVRALLLDDRTTLTDIFRSHAFDVEPHFYMSRAIATGPVPQSRRLPETLRADGWKDGDEAAVAALLHRAYGSASGGVLFAPTGQLAEWERYVGNMAAHGGCGVLNRVLTRVVRGGQDVRAAAIISDIGPRTAHLVQLAVDDPLRGTGLGRLLMDDACARLHASGYTTFTLMVGGANGAARSLYDRAGFRCDATFVNACRDRAASALEARRAG